MAQCSRCLKEFRGQFELSRHNRRKYPCKPKEKTLYDGEESPYDGDGSLYDGELTQYNGEESSHDVHRGCVYCKCEFTERRSARRHEQDCKENDKLRKLEIELGIALDKYHEKDCSF